MKDDTVYLNHILECVRRIEENVSGGRDAFFASHALQDATLRNLQTMSEATQRLSDTTRAQQPHIPWHQIAGFRNVLVHNYLGLDFDLIWMTIHRDVPSLKQAVTAILEARES